MVWSRRIRVRNWDSFTWFKFSVGALRAFRLHQPYKPVQGTSTSPPPLHPTCCVASQPCLQVQKTLTSPPIMLRSINHKFNCRERYHPHPTTTPSPAWSQTPRPPTRCVPTTGTQCPRFLHHGSHVIHVRSPSFQHCSLVAFDFVQHHKEDHNHSASSQNQWKCPQLDFRSHCEANDSFGHGYLGLNLMTWCFMWFLGVSLTHCCQTKEMLIPRWMRISELMLKLVTL